MNGKKYSYTSISTESARNVTSSCELVYADFYERFFAFLIDSSFLLLSSWIITMCGFYFTGIGISEYFNGMMHLILPVLVIMGVLLSTYFIFTNALFGRSVGKIFTGIYIVQDNGVALNPGISFVRWVGYYISAIPLFAGFFWVIADPENRSWHDRLSGTMVVKDMIYENSRTTQISNKSKRRKTWGMDS